MKGMIEVTEDKLVDLAKAAYALSRPQGLGFLNYEDGDLTDEEAKQLVERSANDKMCALSMDYVKGRACKFSVYRSEGKLWIDKDRWFDHSQSDLAELHRRAGIAA